MPEETQSVTSEEGWFYPDTGPTLNGNTALDLSWINLDDIRLWLRTCDTEHGHECQAADTQTVVAWLIDVHQECLIPCDSNTNYQYVALSYIWGQCPSSQTKKDKLGAYQTPGAFSENNPQVIIPKTIRHAIKLVALLDIRYLWVDRFCICQDDAESMPIQLQQMGSVYEMAYLTLIAANGEDADHGLHGIKGVTERRHLPTSPDFHNLYYNNLRSDINAFNPSKWYSRGWTFQELFYSRRKLKFQYEVVLWECNCAHWHESTGVTGKLPPLPGDCMPLKCNFRMTGSSICITPWTVNKNGHPLSTYLTIINLYNGRVLTHAGDRMHAFAGVTTKLEADFPGGFIWGLSVAYFEIALLWQSRYQFPSKRRNRKWPDSLQLPSWSWVGWDGTIIGSNWDSHNLNIRIARGEDATSAAPVDDGKTFQRLVIPSCEWHCITFTLYDTLPIVSNFRLACEPEFGRARGKIQDQQNAIQPLLKTWAKFVNCMLAVDYDGGIAAIYHANADLGSATNSEHDPVIGYVLLPKGNFKPSKHRRCELMLLSKSLTRKPAGVRWSALYDPYDYYSEWCIGLFGGDDEEEKNDSAEIQWYDVLWIVRRDGIVYRRGLGAISVEAFDSLPNKTMEIVLG
ncbi:hypothetical protein Hte_004163 [Hypoxylon texense]